VATITKGNKNPAAQTILKGHLMQLLKQKHLESLNLTLDSQPSKGDEWERVCLAQEDVKMIKMSREVPKSRPPTIYKCPQRIVPLGSTLCLMQGTGHASQVDRM
jgi:hypothetical protein